MIRSCTALVFPTPEFCPPSPERSSKGRFGASGAGLPRSPGSKVPGSPRARSGGASPALVQRLSSDSTGSPTAAFENPLILEDEDQYSPPTSQPSSPLGGDDLNNRSEIRKSTVSHDEAEWAREIEYGTGSFWCCGGGKQFRALHKAPSIDELVGKSIRVYWMKTPEGLVPATDGMIRRHGTPDPNQPDHGAWYDCSVVRVVYRSKRSSLTQDSAGRSGEVDLHKHTVHYGDDGPHVGDMVHNLLNKRWEDGRPDTSYIALSKYWDYRQ